MNLNLNIHPRDMALFFDVDGTLIEIAATPNSVVVPATLEKAILTLWYELDGAIALVSGRNLSSVEALFPSFPGVIGALHGSEFRFADGRKVTAEVEAQLEEARNFLHVFASSRTGFLIEDKIGSIALHYRGAPTRKREAETAIQEASKLAGPSWSIQPGKFVFELRSRGANKGKALKRIMNETPFHNRRPLAFGDDLTDLPMLKAAKAAGGLAVVIGRAIHPEGEFHAITSPLQLQAWLKMEAERLSGTHGGPGSFQ